MRGPITVANIELLVAYRFGIRKHLIIPNVADGFWIHECDLFIVKPSMYCAEVEIKMSVSDFKADFKKSHAHKDRYNRIKEFWYCVPHYIKDKIMPLLPESAGLMVVYVDEDHHKYQGVGTYIRTEKQPVVNKGARKITEKELIILQRLALFRLWDYKRDLEQMRHEFNDKQRIL